MESQNGTFSQVNSCPREVGKGPERSSPRTLSERCCHKTWTLITATAGHPGAGVDCSAQAAGAEMFPGSPHRTKAPSPTLAPGTALPFSYVGGIVEQERAASLRTVSDEVPGEFVVEWHQIRERYRLLHDALVPEQWDCHQALVTSPKALDVRWEAGEILAGALERINNTLSFPCVARQGVEQSLTAAHHQVLRAPFGQPFPETQGPAHPRTEQGPHCPNIIFSWQQFRCFFVAQKLTLTKGTCPHAQLPPTFCKTDLS